MIVVAYVLIYWMLGMGAADLLPSPKYPTMPGYPASYCRPHPYDKLGLKPWPFRRGRVTNESHEGDMDYCTGETYRGGKWVK